MKTTKEKVSLLDVIPCRKPHILTEQKGDYVVIAFPRFKKKWIQRLLLPKSMSPYIHVTLEEHGTAVWNMIDGKATVHEIIDRLASHFNNEPGYESRITLYISQLRKDGFVTYMLPSHS